MGLEEVLGLRDSLLWSNGGLTRRDCENSYHTVLPWTQDEHFFLIYVQPIFAFEPWNYCSSFIFLSLSIFFYGGNTTSDKHLGRDSCGDEKPKTLSETIEATSNNKEPAKNLLDDDEQQTTTCLNFWTGRPGHARVPIFDNGIGFDEDLCDMNRLFEYPCTAPLLEYFRGKTFAEPLCMVHGSAVSATNVSSC